MVCQTIERYGAAYNVRHVDVDRLSFSRADRPDRISALRKLGHVEINRIFENARFGLKNHVKTIDANAGEMNFDDFVKGVIDRSIYCCCGQRMRSEFCDVDDTVLLADIVEQCDSVNVERRCPIGTRINDIVETVLVADDLAFELCGKLNADRTTEATHRPSKSSLLLETDGSLNRKREPTKGERHAYRLRIHIRRAI